MKKMLLAVVVSYLAVIYPLTGWVQEYKANLEEKYSIIYKGE